MFSGMPQVFFRGVTDAAFGISEVFENPAIQIFRKTSQGEENPVILIVQKDIAGSEIRVAENAANGQRVDRFIEYSPYLENIIRGILHYVIRHNYMNAHYLKIPPRRFFRGISQVLEIRMAENAINGQWVDRFIANNPYLENIMRDILHYVIGIQV